MATPNLPDKSGSLTGITSTSLAAACKSFNDNKNSCMKTPISLLQEICTKSAYAPPSYELITSAGRSHEQLFVYKCSLGTEFHVHGKGTSKKKAKHAAALGVLNHLAEQAVSSNDSVANMLKKLITSLNDLDISNLSNNVLDEATVADSNALTEDLNATPKNELVPEAIGINPVGELIEIAQRCSLRSPEFEYGDEEGPPHNRSFLCHATFGTEIVETATGRSKKIAKRLAAIKLLKTVRENSEIQDLLSQYLLKQQTNGTYYKQLTMSKGNASSRMNGQSTKSIGGGNRKGNTVFLIQRVKTSQNPAALRLLDPNLEDLEVNLNKSLLDALAEQEGFEFKFYMPPNSAVSVQNYVVLSLTSPGSAITTFGNKATSNESLAHAIFTMLMHFRVMCSINN